jgi:hypothetical protein
MAVRLALVLIRPSFILGHYAILSCLKYCGVFDAFALEAGIPVDTLLAQWEHAPYIPVNVQKYESDHHFGPTLHIEGPDGAGTMELTVPWTEIVGVLIDHSHNTGKMGFSVSPPTS